MPIVCLRLPGSSAESTEGSRSSPLNDVACFCCYWYPDGAVLVVRLFPSATAVGSAPTPGAKSKRISLVADVAVIFRSNQYGPCSMQFLLFSAWSWGEPLCTSSPKESVSCASAFLSLFCWSRYVLFLLWGCLLLLLFRISKQVPCQFYKVLLFQCFDGFRGVRLRRKNRAIVTDDPGFCYGVCAGGNSLQPAVVLDLRRGMPRRWRRSHRHLRLMPSLRASSVSVMWSWCSSTKCWK